MCDDISFLTCERADSVAKFKLDSEGVPHDYDGFSFARLPYSPSVDVALVLAITRHRNPGARVFFYDHERDVIRIH
jgi:hypothetical protein